MSFFFYINKMEFMLTEQTKTFQTQQKVGAEMLYYSAAASFLFSALISRLKKKKKKSGSIEGRLM